MADQITNALEDHFMTIIVLSAAAALLIVLAVALFWWIGGRWVRKQRTTFRDSNWLGIVKPMDHTRTPPSPMASGGSAAQPDRTEPDHPLPAGAEPDHEPWSSRFVRETATRTAALRDTWDRSYRAARTPDADQPAASEGSTASLLDELLAEQRQTNALLGEVLAELRRR